MIKKGGMNMENIEIAMERHEQQLKVLEKNMAELREVQFEIRSMNETLLTLANEIKHTNEHLARHEKKIEEIDSRPKIRIQQIATAIISAVTGGIISIIIGNIFSE